MNRVLRRLTITPTTCDADLEPLIDEYEKALDECGENHDDIDQDIAKAQDKLDKASSPIEEAKAEKRIARLKRRERITTWVLPLLVASLLLMLGTSQ